MENTSELSKLTEHLSYLQQSNAALREEIKELADFTEECDWLDKIYGKSRTRGGYFGRMRNLPDFKGYWHDTAFWKFHQELDRYKFVTLDQMEKILASYRGDCGRNPLLLFSCNLLVYCEMAMPTEKGAILHLMDPFGERDVLAATLATEKLKSHIGHVLYISCIEKPKSNNLQVVKVEKLPYTLYEKVG